MCVCLCACVCVSNLKPIASSASATSEGGGGRGGEEGEVSDEVIDLQQKLAILKKKRLDDKAHIKELEKCRVQWQQVSLCACACMHVESQLEWHCCLGDEKVFLPSCLVLCKYTKRFIAHNTVTWQQDVFDATCRMNIKASYSYNASD